MSSKKISLVLISFLSGIALTSCFQETPPPEAVAAAPADDHSHRAFYEAHANFREPVIEDRRFKHGDIAPLIRALPPPFEVVEAGRSVEEREIYHVRLGTGSTSVLLWSQMHGDEATATMALMDIFRFFQASGDEFDDYREEVLSKLTLHFIPMLNPDGAELFTRRNRLHIDINRDALRLTSPEAQLLKRIRDEVQADWGFNLHDQGFYYGVGDTPKQASISFLAPAFNQEKEVNEVRKRAIQLIGGLNRVVQDYLPGQVGRYSDEFEPRAFGDNIQKWGTSTILIETGGLNGDPEKQQLRRINFTVLLSAFQRIAEGSFANEPMSAYESIPFNNYGASQDLILRGVEMAVLDNWYTVDIAFQRREVEYDEHEAYYYRSSITDIGHLSNFFAFQDFDGEGYRAVPAGAFPRPLAHPGGLKQLNLPDLLRQGITDFNVDEWPKDNRYHTLPIRLLPKSRKPDNEIRLGNNPSLLLQKDGETHFVVVNGMLYDLKEVGEYLKMVQ